MKNTKVGQRRASLKKLLDAAKSLFVSQGYKSTTLENIANAAGLTKGAVYFYFGSKEAVLISLLDQAEKAVFEPGMEVLIKSSGSPKERMATFLNHQARIGVTNREDIFLLILMSLEFSKGAVADRIRLVYRKLQRRLEQLIKDGQELGELRRDLPARELASIVIANHDGAFLEWYRQSSRLNGVKLARCVQSVVLDGLSLRDQLERPNKVSGLTNGQRRLRLTRPATNNRL